MTEQANILDFKPSGKPKNLRSLFKNDGWKRYSFDVFNSGKEAAGRLDINIAQHPKHVSSWEFYLFDSDDPNKATVFESPIPYPPETKEELFEQAKKRACYYYVKRSDDARQPIPLDQTTFYR